MRRTFVAAVAAVAALSFATVASAATIVTTFKLDTSEAFTPPAGGLGKVVVTDYGTGALFFDVTLFDPANWEFRKAPDGNHHAATFKLDVSGLAIQNLISDVQVGAFTQLAGSSFSNKPFSGFNYGIGCVTTKCVPGFNAAKNPDHMSFSVAGVSINDLKSVPYTPKGGGPTKNIFFAVDLVHKNGGTGAVGATWFSQVSYAPEPATWAMLILGFGCIGADFRRRRARALAA